MKLRKGKTKSILEGSIDAALLASEMQKIRSYIDNYRSSLRDEVFNPQEYSIKLIQIPKVSNTNRNDLAIEFVRLDKLDSADKERYQQIKIQVQNYLFRKN